MERLVGEEIFHDDDVKQRLYPYAERAIAYLDDDYHADHKRAHLVHPTVMLVAAAARFTSTRERPIGVALLRQLADLLERKALSEIPWGPANPNHKPVFRKLVDEHLGSVRFYPGDDGMFALMSDLEKDFHGKVDRLVSEYEESAEGATEELIVGFLTMYMLRKLAGVEEPGSAWALVREEAKDQGWIVP
jgi:hypothetical protein